MDTNALHHAIDQLHLAAEQLRRGHPTYSRFALILVDNAVELMLHRRAEAEFKREQLFFFSKPQKYSDEQRKEVLGQHFDSKAKFARDLGEINEVEMEFILHAHGFRNQLYHAGLKHETVIGEIAWHYHGMACRLFGQFRDFMMMWLSNEPVTPTVEIYCGPQGLNNLETELPRIAAQLDAARGPIGRPLAVVLSETIVMRMEEMTSNLDFIVSDAPGKKSREAWVFELQIWPFMDSAEGKALIAANQTAKPRSLEEIIEILQRCWKPPVTVKTIAQWETRARELAAESSPHMALKKYVQLSRQSDEFYEQVYQTALALDREIDSQIDRMRERDD